MKSYEASTILLSVVFVTKYKSIPIVQSFKSFKSFKSFQPFRSEVVWTSATSGMIRSGVFLMIPTCFFLFFSSFNFPNPISWWPRLSRELDSVWSALRSFVGSTNNFFTISLWQLTFFKSKLGNLSAVGNEVGCGDQSHWWYGRTHRRAREKHQRAHVYLFSNA